MLYLFKDFANGFPTTCHEVQESGGQEGYHTLDPEQDGLDPISVFCNMSSSPVTAVLHHNREEWTHVTGYEDIGSYDGQVRSWNRYASGEYRFPLMLLTNISKLAYGGHSTVCAKWLLVFLIHQIDHRTQSWYVANKLLSIAIYQTTWCFCLEAIVWKWRDSGTSSWIDSCVQRVYLFSTHALCLRRRIRHLLAVKLWTDKRVGKVRRDVLSTRLASEKPN